MDKSKAPHPSWQETTLGELISLRTGKLDANAAVADGDFPFFTCAEAISKIDTWAFDSQAVLLAGNGSFSVKRYSGKFNAYQRTYVIEPVVIPISFLYWLIRAHIKKITESERGTAIPYIRKGDITDISLLLPALAEQKAIAGKLDTLLAQVKTTKARLERIPQILKRFRQSVLAAAVSGRLTEEWRTTKQLRFDWKKEHFSELLLKLRSGAAERPDDNPKGIPILRSSAVRPMEVDFNDVRYITESAALKPDNYLQQGDLLFTRLSGTAEYVGNCAMVKKLDRLYQYPDRLFCARLKDPDQAIFLEYYFAAQPFRDHIVGSLKSSAGHQRITLEVIRNAVVLMPSLEEQTEIVRRVDQLFAHVDRIEQQVQAAQERVNNLTQSILAKAFRGELTEQWRKDHPELVSGENSAAALLERIKAERATNNKTRKTPRPARKPS